jgi:hypothetical protein
MDRLAMSADGAILFANAVRSCSRFSEAIKQDSGPKSQRLDGTTMGEFRVFGRFDRTFWKNLTLARGVAVGPAKDRRNSFTGLVEFNRRRCRTRTDFQAARDD